MRQWGRFRGCCVVVGLVAGTGCAGSDGAEALPADCNLDVLQATVVPAVNVFPAAGSSVKVGEAVTHRFEVDGAPVLFIPATFGILEDEKGDHTLGQPVPDPLSFNYKLTETLLRFEAPPTTWTKTGKVHATIKERWKTANGCWWRVGDIWNYTVVDGSGDTPDAGSSDTTTDTISEAETAE